MMALVNPYLDFFQTLPVECRRNPFLLPSPMEWPSLEGDRFKTSVASHFSWAVPTQQAIAAIVSVSVGVVEVGAGSGYWAWLMRQAGLPVAAFDIKPPSFTWTRVDASDERAAAYFPSYTLFLCWPPWNTDMAANALRLYQGDHVAYVGEWMGGSGNFAFFSQLTSEFNMIGLINIPQWRNRDDRLMIFRRRSLARLERPAGGEHLLVPLFSPLVPKFVEPTSSLGRSITKPGEGGESIDGHGTSTRASRRHYETS